MSHATSRTLLARPARALLALVLLLAPLPGRTPAQADEDATPRGALLGFLEAANDGDYARAVRYLDLSGIPPERRAEEGPRLARQVKTVLDRTLWVDLELMSDALLGNEQDGLAPGRDKIEGTPTDDRAPAFYVERVTREDGALVWRISAGTLARVPQLYRRNSYGALVEALPPILIEREFLAIALWQWLGLLVLVVASYLGAWIGAGIVVRVLRPLISRSRTNLDERLLALTVPPLRLLGAVGLFRAGLPFLLLKVPAQNFFVGALTLLVVLAAAWLIFRSIDLLAVVLSERMRQRGRASAVYLVPLGARTLKVAVAVMTVLAGLDNLGFDVTAIIAGLGVGGLAVALALQPTLANVFGGITVLTDQPVKPGELCRYGDKLGTVEEVGLRSTRIRSLDRTVVSVPNADFAAMQIENFARRDRIRLLATLGLRYETTADQLRHAIGSLRRLLHAHPKVHPDPCRVRFVGFGAYSLDVEIFCYVETTDNDEFLAIREDIFLRIIDAVHESGTAFAFPSSTTYQAQDPGLDAERARAAEAQVAAWRKQGELMFPELNDEQLRAIEGTLEYPPEGSALAGRA